jgi:hypothetical protein
MAKSPGLILIGMGKGSGAFLLSLFFQRPNALLKVILLESREGCSSLMTVGGMDADTKRTGKYLQRVMSEGRPLLPYYYFLLKLSERTGQLAQTPTLLNGFLKQYFLFL